MLVPYYNVYERIIWQVKYPNCDWEDERIEDWVLRGTGKLPYDEYRYYYISDLYFADDITEIRRSSE